MCDGSDLPLLFTRSRQSVFARSPRRPTIVVMFKRVIWWATGAVAGTLGSRWLERKAKQVVAEKVAAAAPGEVARRVRSAARSRNDATREKIRSAIAEGRSAANSRETQLRENLRRK